MKDVTNCVKDIVLLPLRSKDLGFSYFHQSESVSSRLSSINDPAKIKVIQTTSFNFLVPQKSLKKVDSLQ